MNKAQFKNWLQQFFHVLVAWTRSEFQRHAAILLFDKLFTHSFTINPNSH